MCEVVTVAISLVVTDEATFSARAESKRKSRSAITRSNDVCMRDLQLLCMLPSLLLICVMWTLVYVFVWDGELSGGVTASRRGVLWADAIV